MNESENMDVMNVEEAAAYLKFSTTFLYRLCRKQLIPHVNYCRHILFRKSDLYAWLGSKVTPSPAAAEVMNGCAD